VNCILIEFDLLIAAMKKEDRLKDTAETILKEVESGRLKGINAPFAAIHETASWFHNRQLFHWMVQAVTTPTHLRNVEWIALTPEFCMTASHG